MFSNHATLVDNNALASKKHVGRQILAGKGSGAVGWQESGAKEEEATNTTSAMVSLWDERHRGSLTVA